MNQIPNIEETHSTREVEEIIEEKIKGYYEDIEQHERTKQAIKNKEIVYIGEFGNVLCEEDYFAWEEWVDSVAIGGSSREKFIKLNLNLHQQLQKAREGAFEEAFSSGHKNGHKDGVKYRSSQMRVFIDKETQDGGLDESWYGAFFAMKRHLESLDHSELDHLPDSPLNQEIE